MRWSLSVLFSYERVGGSRRVGEQGRQGRQALGQTRQVEGTRGSLSQVQPVPSETPSPSRPRAGQPLRALLSHLPAYLSNLTRKVDPPFGQSRPRLPLGN